MPSISVLTPPEVLVKPYRKSGSGEDYINVKDYANARYNGIIEIGGEGHFNVVFDTGLGLGFH